MSYTVPSAKTVAALSAALLVSTAVYADTPHFLSDKFAIPSAPAAAPAKKPLYDSPNNHLERIPKCNLYFDYRQFGPEMVVIYPHPSSPKAAPKHKPRVRSMR